jgi:hypothetical protein
LAVNLEHDQPVNSQRRRCHCPRVTLNIGLTQLDVATFVALAEVAADTVGHVAGVERLVTVVDLDERDQGGHSAWAHLYVVLDSGRRHRVLDDRGWSSSAAIAEQGLRQIEDTARMVVGPDGPGPGETDEQIQAWYWEWMERKLRDVDISAAAGELEVLPHDVEIGERLRHRLDMSI